MYSDPKNSAPGSDRVKRMLRKGISWLSLVVAVSLLTLFVVLTPQV